MTGMTEKTPYFCQTMTSMPGRKFGRVKIRACKVRPREVNDKGPGMGAKSVGCTADPGYEYCPGMKSSRPQ